VTPDHLGGAASVCPIALGVRNHYPPRGRWGKPSESVRTTIALSGGCCASVGSMIKFLYAHIALRVSQQHPELFTEWHREAIVGHWYDAHAAVTA
jgi:hypothetical protein